MKWWGLVPAGTGLVCGAVFMGWSEVVANAQVADFYNRPIEILHPGSREACHSIVTTQAAEVKRLTAEHQDCITKFHAPPREAQMTEATCSLSACQPLHSSMTDAKHGNAVASRYEAECLRAYEAEHKKDAAAERPAFLDDPAPGTHTATGADSVSQAVAAQQKKNADALKPGANYQASYTVGQIAPSGAAVDKPKYGYCYAIGTTGPTGPQAVTTYTSAVQVLRPGLGKLFNAFVAREYLRGDSTYLSDGEFCNAFDSAEEAEAFLRNAQKPTVQVPGVESRHVLTYWVAGR